MVNFFCSIIDLFRRLNNACFENLIKRNELDNLSDYVVDFQDTLAIISQILKKSSITSVCDLQVLGSELLSEEAYYSILIEDFLDVFGKIYSKLCLIKEKKIIFLRVNQKYLLDDVLFFENLKDILLLLDKIAIKHKKEFLTRQQFDFYLNTISNLQIVVIEMKKRINKIGLEIDIENLKKECYFFEQELKKNLLFCITLSKLIRYVIFQFDFSKCD